MKNQDLAQDHFHRARGRLKAIDALFAEKGWADVVRESQEAVELALKGLLMRMNVEPPRIHDVSEVLREEASRLPRGVAGHLEELCEISRDLRRDRELAFYGSEDLTPSDFYREKDAKEARRKARRVMEIVSREFT